MPDVGGAVGETVGTRLSGQRVSRTRAFFVAAVAAAGAGVLVYRVLRSGGDDD
jgi:hypothetical protein